MNSYEIMEMCLDTPDSSSKESFILNSLFSENWKVRYAAAIGASFIHNHQSAEAILRAMENEDLELIYNQPPNLNTNLISDKGALYNYLGREISDAELIAWQRRGRLKQMLCYAAGEIGIVTEDLLMKLHGYAINVKGEDFVVRTAACNALGKLSNLSSIPYLEQAVNDNEWCTRKEANKALAMLYGK